MCLMHDSKSVGLAKKIFSEENFDTENLYSTEKSTSNTNNRTSHIHLIHDTYKIYIQPLGVFLQTHEFLKYLFLKRANYY